MSGACITAVGASGGPVKFAAVWGQDSTQNALQISEMDMVRYIAFPHLSFASPLVVIVRSTSLSNDTSYLHQCFFHEGNTSIFIARIDGVQEL